MTDPILTLDAVELRDHAHDVTNNLLTVVEDVLRVMFTWGDLHRRR